VISSPQNLGGKLVAESALIKNEALAKPHFPGLKSESEEERTGIARGSND